MRANESNPAAAAAYAMLAFLIVSASLLAFLLIKFWPEPDTFSTDCRAQHGHVYTMDADHRVCLRNGKVISR